MSETSPTPAPAPVAAAPVVAKKANPVLAFVKAHGKLIGVALVANVIGALFHV